MFGVDEIKDKLDAQCAVLNSNQEFNFKSYFYLQLLKSNPYCIVMKKNDKIYECPSELEAESMVYLSDLNVCSTSVEYFPDKKILTFTLNENFSNYFYNFYKKKLRALKDKLSGSKKEKDIVIYSALIEAMKGYEKYFIE